MTGAVQRRIAGCLLLTLAAGTVAASVYVPNVTADAGRPAGLRPRGVMPALASPLRAVRARARRAKSIGHPWDGRLEHAKLLHESATVKYLADYRAPGYFFGTSELVGVLERAAARVARRFPRSKLYVGELSRARGGEIDGHHSHEAGRDADVAFFMLDAARRPIVPRAFAKFDSNGKGIGVNAGLIFDDARNWEFVARVVADGEAKVQFIFVGDALRRRILAEGRRRRAPRSLLERVAIVLVQPAEGHPHENHFHIRIYCDPRDRPSCRDRAPFWPWYPGTP